MNEMKKLDKSLTFFFVSAILLFLAISFHSVIEFDQDLGRHLLLGGIIIDNFSVPQVNLLSYTHSTYPFINSHWLAEVVFAAVGNITALLWLKVVIFISAFTLTLVTAYKYSKSLWATALCFVFLAPVLLERTEIRPEIFSFLFTAIFLYILLLKNKLWWLLPIIELIWVNTHIYFFLGPALSLIFLQRKQWYVPLIIALATLVNPNFISGALFPLSVFGNYGYSIVENQHIFFLYQVISNPNINYFFIAISFALVVLLFSQWRKISLSQFAWLSLSVLPFIAIRNFPLFFLLELPIISYLLASGKLRLEKYGRYIIIAAIVLTLIRTGRLVTNEYYYTVSSNKSFGSEVKESGKGAMDFVLASNLEGPIFNSFDNGSYITYRAYPKLKVFVDGRPEAYPKEFFQEVYIPMQLNPEVFENVDSQIDFKTVIFFHTDGTTWGQQFLTDIVKNPRYRMVYLDSATVVFTTDATVPIVEPNDILTMGKTSKDDLYLARAAQIFGWNDLANRLMEKAYLADPQLVRQLTGESPLVLF